MRLPAVEEDAADGQQPRGLLSGPVFRRWPPGRLPGFVRPLLMTNDGTTVGDLIDDDEYTDPRSVGDRIGEQFDSLLRQVLLTRDGHARGRWNDETLRHTLSEQRRARAVATQLRVPALVRPFFLTRDGDYVEGTDESSVVAAARWAEASAKDWPGSWGTSFIRTFTLEIDGDATLGGAATSLATFQQSDERIPPPHPEEESERESTDRSGDPFRDDPGQSDENSGQGGIAGDQRLGEEPEDNSLQFLRFDTVLLEPGEMQFDYGITYAISERDFPLALIPSGVAEANVRQRQLVVPLELRYGLARRAQFFVNVPLGWANNELAVAGIDEFDNAGGIGDVRAGITFLLKQNKEKSRDITGTFSFTAPTGGGSFFLGGSALTPADMGDGFWALSGDVLVIEDYDPIVLFYGFNTRHRFSDLVSGFLVTPGGEYSYRFGVGFGVNERITLSSTFFGSYISDLQINGRRIEGTTQEPLSLRFSATIARKKKIVEPFVSFGLTRDATNAQFGITWTH